jgi:hypothetical protein
LARPEYLHWQRLHEAANEARERVSKAYVQMDEIDRNADLSRDGKYRQLYLPTKMGRVASSASTYFLAC